MADARLTKIQESLVQLEKNRDLASAKKVVRNVSSVLVPSLSEDIDSIFRLFNDQDGKLKANAGWFFSDSTITDKLATYTLDTPADSNLDIKVFGVKKAKKGTISWAVGLTPNFEDEPFNGKFNVGIDFIIPESLDRVIVALSKNYVIRTLELKGQLTATFQEILNSWLSVTDLSRKVEFHEILWNSLDLSPINKKFYEGISQRFIALRQHIETSGALDHEHAAQFANRLIGRVIFTWFLDKKSLIEPSLKYFQSDDYKDDTDYYRDKLEPLFFEVLNTPVPDRTATDKTTPYLNGGLFEPKPGDLYKDKTLTFPKNFFDDFLGFLRAYNFTTDESTTEFQQVAIDPEMLGRIFENLLAEVNEETGEQARKAKGAFYTPRQIVDFMCREALKTYLRKSLDKTPDLEARLFQLIDASERDFQDQDHNWRRDLKPHRDKVLEALDHLRILDPACGSGAFPIGMMQLLVKVRSRLDPKTPSYLAKLSIVENNLFGVDVEPMAVEISRLRTWLALVVDEGEDSKTIRPLPNLDFKFVCANSLIHLDQSTQVSLFEDLGLDDKLKEIRTQYFSTQSQIKKKQLRKRYSDLVDKELPLDGETRRTTQLKTFRPFESDAVASFFDSYEMFGTDSFQILIGNPPYVNVEKIDKKVKAEAQMYSTAYKKYDLYVLFYERAIKLLAEGGVIAFITSNKFLSQEYGKLLRQKLLELSIASIVNFELDVFETATVRTCIILAQKSPPIDQSIRVLNIRSKPKTILLDLNDAQVVKQSLFNSLKDNNFRLTLNEKKVTILERIQENTIALKDICSVNYGLRPSGKAANDNTRKGDIISETPVLGYKPYFEGKDMGYWTVARSRFIRYEPEKMYNAMFPELFSNPKLIGIRTLSDIGKARFVFDDRGLLCNDSVVVLTLWKYFEGLENITIQSNITQDRVSNSKSYSYGSLQAILNSSIIKFHVQELIYDGTHFYPNQMKSLPIPKVDQAEIATLESLALACRDAERKGSSVEVFRLQKDLDIVVGKLYGLSREEVNYISEELQVPSNFLS